MESGVESFRFKRGDIKLYEDLNHVEVVVFHSWNTSRVRIAQIGRGERHRAVYRENDLSTPWPGTRSSALLRGKRPGIARCARGEWYLERATGKLFYWPLPEERIGEVEVVAPVLGELVRLEGYPDAGDCRSHPFGGASARTCGLVFARDRLWRSSGYSNRAGCGHGPRSQAL